MATCWLIWQTGSMADHSTYLKPGKTVRRGDPGYDDSGTATFVPACVCGWQSAHAYTRMERANRRMRKHLEESREPKQ